MHPHLKWAVFATVLCLAGVQAIQHVLPAMEKARLEQQNAAESPSKDPEENLQPDWAKEEAVSAEATIVEEDKIAKPDPRPGRSHPLEDVDHSIGDRRDPGASNSQQDYEPR